METDKLPVNIFISPNGSNNPETIQAIQKGIQEALEKFEGKSIVYFHIKNLHTGPVGKHHPAHHCEESPWPKFGHRRGKHHGDHHFRGKHGFKGKHGHHRWGKWWFHTSEQKEIVSSGQVNIQEIPSTPTQEKDRNSKSSDDWCLLEYRSSDTRDNEKGQNGKEPNEEELRVRFDNMDVTKSV